jgi:hypothetical protein
VDEEKSLIIGDFCVRNPSLSDYKGNRCIDGEPEGQRARTPGIRRGESVTRAVSQRVCHAGETKSFLATM